MAYTTAQMNAATGALVSAIHGLHPDVARAWASAEQGVNYNILGVTYVKDGRQHLFTYGSWGEGAQAAAHLIATGPYGGVRSALAGGTSAQQARAIIASPWNHPYYSTGRGAIALRAVAAQPANAPHGTRYHLVVRGATPVYDAMAGARHTPRSITSGTYVAEMFHDGTHIWYKVVGPSTAGIVGKWMPAEPTMTATKL
jgi:hypothetical protein